MSELTDLFGPVAHSYTRENAVLDGMLVDIASLDPKTMEQNGLSNARRCGYLLPVFITAGVTALMGAARAHGSDDADVAWDLLWMARSFAWRKMRLDAIATQASFPCIVAPSRRPTTFLLDFDGRAFTILLPNER